MRSYGRRSRYRPQPFTVDHFDKLGRFITSEAVIARNSGEAEYLSGQRREALGSSNWRVFDEGAAVRSFTEDLHRTLRAMSSGRVQPSRGDP
jgi:hypothetical protein